MTTRVGVAIANADALDVLQPRTNTGDGQTNRDKQREARRPVLLRVSVFGEEKAHN